MTPTAVVNLLSHKLKCNLFLVFQNFSRSDIEFVNFSVSENASKSQKKNGFIWKTFTGDVQNVQAKRILMASSEKTCAFKQ